MVLGSGLVASGFKAYQDDKTCLVFASGVSNSTNQDPEAFTREGDLLKNAVREHSRKRFIYFGTCSTYDPSQADSPYVKHKLAMEDIVREGHRDYHIFRISNLVGRTNNPHTVVNFFVQHIRSGQFFFLWKNASRNIIDLQDAVVACTDIVRRGLYRNEVVNVANPVNYPVMQLIKAIESILDKVGNYEMINKGSDPQISTGRIEEIYHSLHIRFDQDYLNRTLQKYLIAHDI